MASLGGISGSVRRALRMDTFEEIYDYFQKHKLSCEEAAELLGCSTRQFHRLRQRYDEDGAAGLVDRRVGQVSRRRAGDDEIALVTRLYRERYRGFSVQHCHEFLCERHGLQRSYSWTKSVLIRHRLVMKLGRGGPHRLRRPRKPMVGMMLHQDASKHVWFGDNPCDLVVTMDDASSEIYSAFFTAEEGTASSFRGIQETIVKRGLFCSFYTDRGSHYFYTPEVGGKVDKHRLTQVGRALKQLGITHIAAYSPEARGRSERMFGTLQDRLVKELALEGITTLAEANHYLQNVYLKRHNQRFAVKPESDQSAFMPILHLDVANILCSHEERVVQNDNTVRYNGLKLQIPQHANRHHFAKATVRIHHYPDDTLAIFYGHMPIGQYTADGKLFPTQQTHTGEKTCIKTAA